MKSFIFSSIIVINLLFFTRSSSGQVDNFPILSMFVHTTPIADTLAGGLPDISDFTVFNTEMKISLFDTTNIDKIYVDLGITGSPGNKLQHVFDWDVYGSTGNGTSYSRTEYDIVLNLGNFSSLINYEASLIIKRTDGSLTDAVIFSR